MGRQKLKGALFLLTRLILYDSIRNNTLFYLFILLILYYLLLFQVIWKTVEYNIGSGFDSTTGKFTAPVDGIYFFHARGRAFFDGDRASYIRYHVNGSQRTFVNSRHNDGYDTITTDAQFKLKKGDTVNIYFGGLFYNPSHYHNTSFEGHLIRQINE